MALETETFEQSNRARFTHVSYNRYMQLKLHMNDQKRKTHKLPMHTLQNRHVSVKNQFKCNTIARAELIHTWKPPQSTTIQTF
jgi:hypothetical protein